MTAIHTFRRTPFNATERSVPVRPLRATKCRHA